MVVCVFGVCVWGGQYSARHMQADDTKFVSSHKTYSLCPYRKAAAEKALKSVGFVVAE